MNKLSDIVEDSVAGLLVLQPLANKNTGGGGVEFAAAQHAVSVSHAVLEQSVVNLPAGVPADRWRMVFTGIYNEVFSHTCCKLLVNMNGCQLNRLLRDWIINGFHSHQPVRPQAVHLALSPQSLIEIVLVQRLI